MLDEDKRAAVLLSLSERLRVLQGHPTTSSTANATSSSIVRVTVKRLLLLLMGLLGVPPTTPTTVVIYPMCSSMLSKGTSCMLRAATWLGKMRTLMSVWWQWCRC